jgi:hypothetical protein
VISVRKEGRNMLALIVIAILALLYLAAKIKIFEQKIAIAVLKVLLKVAILIIIIMIIKGG